MAGKRDREPRRRNSRPSAKAREAGLCLGTSRSTATPASAPSPSQVVEKSGSGQVPGYGSSTGPSEEPRAVRSERAAPDADVESKGPASEAVATREHTPHLAEAQPLSGTPSVRQTPSGSEKVNESQAAIRAASLAKAYQFSRKLPASGNDSSSDSSESEPESEGEKSSPEAPVRKKLRLRGNISATAAPGDVASRATKDSAGVSDALNENDTMMPLRDVVSKTPSAGGISNAQGSSADDCAQRWTPHRDEAPGSSGGVHHDEAVGVELSKARKRINEQKLLLKQITQEKGLMVNHASMLEKQVGALSLRNERLEKQAKENAKLLADLQSQLCAARREMGKDGERDPASKRRKPRIKHKHLLNNIRIQSVDGMAQELGRVAQLRHKMIGRMDDAFLRMVSSRGARSLYPLLPATHSRGVSRSDTQQGIVSWIPEPRKVRGGKGTVPANPVSGRGTDGAELVRMPENPLLAAQRPLYGGAFVAIPGLLMKSGTPSDYVGITIELAKLSLTWLPKFDGQRTGASTAIPLDLPRNGNSQSPRSMTASPSEDPAHRLTATFSDEDVDKAAAEIAETTGMRSAIHNVVVRAVGELKKSFTEKFLRSALDTEKLQTSPSNGSSNKGVLASLPVHMRLAVAHALGGGDSATLTEVARTSCLATWSRGLHKSIVPSGNPFSCWRSGTVDDIQTSLDDILDHVIAEYGSAVSSDAQGETFEVLKDSWGPQSEARRPCGVESMNQCVDRLFLNAHSVAAMQTFCGFPSYRSGSVSDGTMTGSTSVLSIARADAWMATVMTVTRAEAEEELRRSTATSSSARPTSRIHGKRNSRFNNVFASIFPLAVEALLLELRGALVEWTEAGGREVEAGGSISLTEHAVALGLNGRSVELHAPFFPGVADELHRVYAQYREGQGESNPEGDVDVSDAAFVALKTQLVDNGFHMGDVFLVNGRKATTAFAIENVRSSQSEVEHFIALTPEFFRSNICYWIGDVLDAYVGRWNPSSKMPKGCKSSMKKGAGRNGTFYEPMSFRDLPTHLDSQSRAGCSANDEETADDDEGDRGGSDMEHEDANVKVVALKSDDDHEKTDGEDGEGE